MSLHPAQHASLLSCSATHTVHPYGLSRYSSTSEEIEEPQAHQVARLLTLKCQQKLASIRGYQEDWDNNGSAKPNAEAIANAEARLPELYRICTSVGVWRDPHISASEDGEIVFEWWNGQRKVTLYFLPEAMEVIRSWGTNIDTEMDERPVPSLDRFLAVWAWLQ